ncbi:MAG: aminotransferase class V-fold PLP-dependent enzyme [Gemmataceae bacterium]|nr:aminotransferase class V-fold PLP-dependent enzyme [Gemmataceae bacterium]
MKQSRNNAPALLGGDPVRPDGPPDWPSRDPEIAAALQHAWDNGTWGKYHGVHCDKLEERLREYLGVSHVLLCGSGTYAVELALRALGVGPGDEVLLAAYDYPGNFLCVHAVGAQPVLVDVRPENWNVSLDAVRAGLGASTKVIIASHLHGGVVPMRELTELARVHKIAVIEDAAQCPGARVQGQMAGRWGDVGIFSFGGSKLLSAGRGGAFVTERADLHQRARNWQLRGNLVCPLSELQAAVLLPQLARLDERNAKRQSAVEKLRQLLAGVPGLSPFRNPPAWDWAAGYYKCGFQLDEQAFGLTRGLLVKAARAEGIALDEGFAGLHVGRSPKRYRLGGPLSEADRAHQGCVVLHHPVLLEDDAALEQIARAVRRIHGARAELARLP